MQGPGNSKHQSRRDFLRRFSLWAAIGAGVLASISLLRQFVPRLTKYQRRFKIGRENNFPVNTFTYLDNAVLERLFDAGLDAIRVSMNSVRRAFYEAYFRPKGYGFSDVVASIALAGHKDKFVSLNYLNLPGFTDTEQEAAALLSFLDNHPVHMIQWRNLNFDPVLYWRMMGNSSAESELIGMRTLMEKVHEDGARNEKGRNHGQVRPQIRRQDKEADKEREQAPRPTAEVSGMPARFREKSQLRHLALQALRPEVRRVRVLGAHPQLQKGGGEGPDG